MRLAINPMQLFSVLLNLALHVPPLVRSAEDAFGGGGTGAQKKQFVLDAVTTALEGATSVAKIKELDAPGAKEAVLGAAGRLADAAVATYHAVGIFKKGGAADPAPAP